MSPRKVAACGVRIETFRGALGLAAGLGDDPCSGHGQQCAHGEQDEGMLGCLGIPVGATCGPVDNGPEAAQRHDALHRGVRRCPYS
jgi:hypothetical protein